jgi:hypothetical protein
VTSHSTERRLPGPPHLDGALRHKRVVPRVSNSPGKGDEPATGSNDRGPAPQIIAVRDYNESTAEYDGSEYAGLPVKCAVFIR